MDRFVQRLSDKPTLFSDCCPAISKPLLRLILQHLPKDPAITLSIGSGSGLLEAAVLAFSKSDGSKQACPALYGVEVESCTNKHLPSSQALSVPSTTSMHPDAKSATALLFVYPRQPSLITLYVETCITGALETLLWLGHRSDWFDVEMRIRNHFKDVKLIDGPGIADYELLVVASGLKSTSDKTLPA